jgi:hypothetical protein
MSAPTIAPTLPSPNTMPISVAVRPSTRTAYTSTTEKRMLLKRFAIPVHAAIARRYVLPRT